jgi:hypothetical protein
MKRALAIPLLVLACKTAPQPRPEEPPAGAYVAALREEYAALGHIQQVLEWYTATQGEPSLQTLVYTGHDRLFRKRALAAIDEVKRQPGLASNEALALTFLSRSLKNEVLRLSLAKFDDEYTDAEANAFIDFGGAKIPYRNVQGLLTQEPDAQKRAQLFSAMNAVRVQKLNPILERKEEAAQKAVREAGFQSYAAFAEELRQVDLHALLEQGIAYVKATDELYKKTLDRVAREELGIEREQLHGADLQRLYTAPKLSRYFSRELELPMLKDFLGGMGLDLTTAAGTEVLIDDSQNPKKRPRAFVEPVDPPRDVRLSVKPAGGLSDYQTLFHEAGHAVHFANATIAPIELVNLGHGAPSEAFGEFFRYSFSDPHWLKRYADLLRRNGKPAPDAQEMSAIERRLALREMTFLRRYAFAKIAYELYLHGQPPSEISGALALCKGQVSDPKSAYQQLFSVAYGFEVTGEEAQQYLTDVDDTFYSADYARAFVLAGMLHDSMRAKFGADFYGDKRVGDFLKKQLFAPGASLSAEDVSDRLGFGGKLDFLRSAERARRLIAEADALEAAKP